MTAHKRPGGGSWCVLSSLWERPKTRGTGPHGGDDTGPGHSLQTPTPPRRPTLSLRLGLFSLGLRVPFFFMGTRYFYNQKKQVFGFSSLRIFNDYGPRIVWLAPCPSLSSRLEQGSGAPPGGEAGPGTSSAAPHPPRAAGGRVCLPTFIQLSSPLQLLQPLDEPICGDQRARDEGRQPGIMEPGLGRVRWPPEENQEQHRTGSQGQGLGTSGRLGLQVFCDKYIQTRRGSGATLRRLL